MSAPNYQQRCVIQALKHSACMLGALALGHGKSAAAHTKAASAWGALAVYAAATVKAGLVSQRMLDAMWVEPIDPLPSGDDEEAEGN